MDDSRYFDLSLPGERPERTAYFVLDSLLKSRIDCGFESNSSRPDEDVNVYLVHLLSSLINTPFLSALLEKRDHDVFEKVRDSGDPRFKSRVYRANADNLLLSSSLFVDSPYVEMEGRREYDDSTRGRIGRGKAYYHYASMFNERVRSASPVVSRVLGILSEDFERYVDVLFHMRGEYFNLYERMKEDHLMSIQQEIFNAPSEGDPVILESLRDEFLDAYWAWHQYPTAEATEALLDAVKRLKAVDSAFTFELPQQ